MSQALGVQVHALRNMYYPVYHGQVAIGSLTCTQFTCAMHQDATKISSFILLTIRCISKVVTMYLNRLFVWAAICRVTDIDS